MADTISLFKYTVLLEVDLTQNQLKSFQKPDGAWAWISPMARFPAGFGVLVIKRHDFTATNVAIQSEIPQVSPGRPCLSTWNLVQNLFHNHRFSVLELKTNFNVDGRLTLQFNKNMTEEAGVWGPR